MVLGSIPIPIPFSYSWVHSIPLLVNLSWVMMSLWGWERKSRISCDFCLLSCPYPGINRFSVEERKVCDTKFHLLSATFRMLYVNITSCILYLYYQKMFLFQILRVWYSPVGTPFTCMPLTYTMLLQQLSVEIFSICMNIRYILYGSQICHQRAHSLYQGDIVGSFQKC